MLVQAQYNLDQLFLKFFGCPMWDTNLKLTLNLRLGYLGLDAFFTFQSDEISGFDDRDFLVKDRARGPAFGHL